MEGAEKLNGEALQVGRRATLGEMMVPQRAITDFFKSPPREDAKKPQTLLGYFKKTGTPTLTSGAVNCDVENVSSAAHPVSLSTCKSDDKNAKRRCGKNKRKRNSVDELNNSLSDFEEVRPAGRNRRRKKVKSADEQLIGHGEKNNAAVAIEGSTNSIAENGEANSETGRTKQIEQGANNIPGDLKQDAGMNGLEPDNETLTMQRESNEPTVENAHLDKSPQKVSAVHNPSPKETKRLESSTGLCRTQQTIENQPHRNKEVKGKKPKKKTNTSDGSVKEELKTDSLNQNEVPAPVVEMSYEDFLKAEEDCSTVQNENEVPELSVPKCYKLFKYFKKNDEGNEVNHMHLPVVDSSLIEGPILTTADVHYEPSPPRTRNGHTCSGSKVSCDTEEVRTSNILLSDEECDLEILEISSEIINVSPAKPSKTQKSSDVISIDDDIDCTPDDIQSSPGVELVVSNSTEQTAELSSAFVRTVEKEGKDSKECSSGSNLRLPQKTTQATLFFSPTGLSMKKTLPEKVVSDEKPSSPVKMKKSKKDAPAAESTPKKPDEIAVNKKKKARPVQQRKSAKDKECPDRIHNETPPKRHSSAEKVPSRRSQRIKHKSGEKSEDCNKSGISLSRKKILRRRYKVSFLEAGGDNRSPIRIRLKRCSKSSGEDDSVVFSPKSSKQTKPRLTKAQKLLEKAKKKATRNMKAEKIIKCTTKTHGKISKMETKAKTEKMVKLRARGKADPSAKTKQQKAKKTPVKLAPIFMKKTESAGGVASPRKQLDIDPEILKQRREFLMSGLPENLRRRTAGNSANALPEYPPIPTDCHIQQKSSDGPESDLDVWRLPDVTLKLNSANLSALPSEEWMNMTASAEIANKLRISQDFSKHSDLNEEAVDPILLEIKRNNPAFPVKRLYQCYRAKKTESETRVFQKSDPAAPATKTSEEGNLHPRDVKRSNSGDSDIVLIGSPEETGKSSAQQRKIRKSGGTTDGTSGQDESTKNLPMNGRLRRSRRKSKTSEKTPTPSAEPKVETLTIDSSPEGAPPADHSVEITEIVKDQLWTDKYQPAQSMEVIGNSGNVKKLKSWLQEWKERTDKETRMLKKLLRQQLKKKGKELEQTQESSNDWWTDDDSDFETGSKEDSDWMEAEDSLCNTMLITGPHGVGKTGTVYALAQELGYQVFEVNAASSRSGKRILGKLQEATQSHQVSKQNLEKLLNTPTTPAKTSDTKATSTSEKLPTAFTNLFKKAHANPEGKKETIPSPKKEKKEKAKAAGAKRKREEEKGSPTPKKRLKAGKGKKVEPVKSAVIDVNETSSNSNTAAVKGLNLSSTSLILFDEVDIAFEEDKGFWAAIQSFMKITKRPIILTTTDGNFAQKFEGRFEQLLYKQPSTANLITYLQVMCLAENVRTDYKDMVNVVQHHKGDVRRCVQSLQYWVESGGGLVQELKAVTSSVPSSIPGGATCGLSLDDTASQSQFSQGLEGTPANRRIPSVIDTPASVIGTPGRSSLPSWGDDDDFVTLKSACRKSCRRIILDESSMESFPSTPQKSNQTTLAVPLSSIPEHDENTVFTTFAEYSQSSLESCKIPPVHRLCPESIMGTTSYSSVEICDIFSENTDIDTVAAIYGHMKQLSCDFISSNLEQLIPLPVQAVDPKNWPLKSNDEINHVEKLQKKPSRIMDDIFTSDSSDEETNDQTQQDDTPANGGKTPVPIWKKLCADLAETLSKERRGHLADTIDTLSDFYDSVSFIDTLSAKFCPSNRPRTRKFDDLPDLVRLTQTAGLSDQLPMHERCKRVNAEMNNDLAAQMSVRSLGQCCEGLGRVYKQVEGCGANNYLDMFSLPVLFGRQHLRLTDDISISSTALTSKKRALENVRSVLPLHMWSSVRTMAMDYTPTLRSICTAEHLKQLAKTKRRFLHYLDAISLPLKESTMNVMCSTFR